jgi:LuxR family maltose regulon positive regulatory protein
VARPRLVDQLDEATARELTLVCTPAGFGKTALLTEWSHCTRRPVAWLTLDALDADSPRFWRHVVAALEPSVKGLSAKLSPLLAGQPEMPVSLLLATLVNVVAEQSEPVVLVLDDYHVIDTRAIHDALTMLVERAPAQLRLVCAARSDPPLPLGRLRARGLLAELRAADLRFTIDESAALLRKSTSRPLDAETVAALNRRTEGWAVGLQLAGLSIDRSEDPAQFVANFSGTHRFVLDFLTEEVLSRQPEDRVEFLLQTSILNQLSGPLCDAITGGSNGQEMLESLDRDSMFLIPLDNARRWWRYHQLFADLLRARLHQAYPERLADLHHNAARWCAESGIVDEAIGHALDSGDVDWAARLIEEHAQPILLKNESTAMVRRWLAGVPTEVVRARPRLGLMTAAVARFEGRLDEAESLLASVDAAYQREQTDPAGAQASMPHSGLGNVPAMLALQRAALVRNARDPDALAECARRALAATHPDDRYNTYAAKWYLTLATFMRGEIADAERSLVDITYERWTADDVYGSLYAVYVRSQAQRARGHLNAARRMCEDAIRQVEATHPDETPPALALVRIGLAQVLLEQGDLDAALEQGKYALELTPLLGYAQWHVAAATTLARVLDARGDTAAAAELFAQLEPTQVEAAAVHDLLNPVGAERARHLLASGDAGEVERWLESLALDEHAEPAFTHEPEYLMLARWFQARGEAERALALLRRWRRLAERQGRTGSVIEIRVLEAAALASLGDERGARSALSEAVAVATPEGYQRVFIEGGPQIRTLLDRSHLPGITPARVAGRPPLVVPLSERELEVLRLLASGMSNREIADELVVALDTVKKHVSHVLTKLEASSRTQAVARAREIGLI